MGKSFALLLAPLRFINVPDYYCILFRRHQSEVSLPGGLVDESKKIYPYLGGEFYSSSKTWIFPSGAKIVLRGLELEDDVYQYKGVQCSAIGFDEITSFTQHQYTYLFSRVRSTNNIRGRVFATTNPQSEGWVKDWIKDLWLDEYGYVKEEMSAKVMWFIRVGDDVVWRESEEEAVKAGVEEFGMDRRDVLPTSFSMIRSSLDDNPSLGTDYRAKLMSMPEKDRKELLSGCWNFDASRGIYFKKDWVDIIEPSEVPLIKFKRIVIGVDLAASPPSPTNRDPDHTCFVKMGMDEHGYFYVLDVFRMRDTIGVVKKELRRYAQKNGAGVPIIIPQDPGGHGLHAFQDHVKNLAGFVVKKAKTEKSKLERFLPFASIAENGLVKVVKGDWNNAFFNELEGFIGDGKRKDDQVDAVSDAFKFLNGGNQAPTNFSLNLSAMTSENAWDI